MAVNSFINTSANSWKDSAINAWSTTLSIYYVRSYVEEPFFIAHMVDTATYELPYSGQIGVSFTQPYGDAPVIITVVNEYYGDAAVLINRYVLSYGDSQSVKRNYDLSWDIFGTAFRTFTEPYAITEFGVVNTIEETYQLKERNFVFTLQELPYYLLDESSFTSTSTVSVIVYPGSGSVDPSLSPGDPGYPAPVILDFLSISVDAGLGQYCISCDIKLPSAVQYAQCNYLDIIEVTIGGSDFTFFVESRERSVSNEAISFQIGLLSLTAKLDAPYSKTIVDNLDDGTGARSLVESMAALQNITVDWQILDWQIPGYAISINDETPLAVIRKVVNAVGAIVQTKPNNDLLIISKYPHAVPTWSNLTPDVTYSTQLDILSLSETLRVNEGYNAFQITDQGSSAEEITLEVEDINGLTKKVKGFRVPFDDGAFPLDTSGMPGIAMDKQVYPVEIQIPVQETDEDPEWEIVEFIDHTGSTSLPIYSIVDWDWIEDDLGAFQIAEGGTLSIIDPDSVPGESLLRIKYMTKYWEWVVAGPTDRPVQFFVPEIEE